MFLGNLVPYQHERVSQQESSHPPQQGAATLNSLVQVIKIGGSQLQ